MDHIQKELKETFEDYQNSKRIDRHLDQLNAQLQKDYATLSRLEKKLEKEFKDIEKLEKLSVKGLFHQVLGSKEKQIEKERQEYLQASLKYDEAKKSVELLEYERDILENKVKDLAKLEKKLNQLVKLREKTLIAENSQQSQQILDLVLQIDNQAELLRNINSILINGKEIKGLMDKMVRHLRNAKNWGQWDMASRRGVGPSLGKYSAIDRARDLSYKTKHLLVRFESDLQEIYGPGHFHFNLQMDSFSRFTDIFFDNLISDWIIQQKIQNALSNVLSVRDRVIRIVQSLDGEKVKLAQNIQEMEDRRKILVIQS